MQQWNSETPDQKAEYERWKNRKVKRAPHNMTEHVLSWRCCSRCGLLSFRNYATKKALREGCEE